jgi:hypothetical protein
MNSRTASQHFQKIIRTAITLCLMLLLCMLVMMNQILYGTNQQDSFISSIECCSDALSHDIDSSNPSGPDEKVPENTNTFSEEYLHEHGDLGTYWTLIKSVRWPVINAKHGTQFLTQFTPPPEVALV